MLNSLPQEILILIFNYLIPFDIIFPFNENHINTKRENNKDNINLIMTSNRILCNLARCDKNLKKIIYEKCLKSIYFKKNINVKSILILKPSIVYAPYDETLTEEDLREIYINNIQLKELYMERNTLIRDFKINCPSLVNYKNSWIHLFHDKYAENHYNNNELTKNIKTPNDLMNNNYVRLKDEEAYKIYLKLFNWGSSSSDFNYDKVKHAIDQNFLSLDLYLRNYDDLKNICQESYLIVNINSFKLFKLDGVENIDNYHLSFFFNACARHINYKVGKYYYFKDSSDILDLGLVYNQGGKFYKY